MTVASLLMEASRETPDLMTCMESSIDFATQMDEDLFQHVVEAMQLVQTSGKNSKSRLNKTYVVKIRLPEEATMTSLSIKASSEDLVWRLKQYVTDKIRIKNKSFPSSQQAYHLENFNGDKINECLTLRDIKGKEHGVRELSLVKGWEPQPLQKLLGGINPCLVAACFKYYLRLMPEPLVPFNQYQSFVDSFKNNQSSSTELRCKCMLNELAKLPPANYTSLRATCELISVTPDESWQKAYTFGPYFLRGKDKSTSAQSQEDSLRAVGDVKVVFELVQFLVVQWPAIQPELPEPPLLTFNVQKGTDTSRALSPSRSPTTTGSGAYAPVSPPPPPATSSPVTSPATTTRAVSLSSKAPPAPATLTECSKCHTQFDYTGFCTECGGKLVPKQTASSASPVLSRNGAVAGTNAQKAADAQKAEAQKAEAEKKRKEEQAKREQEERTKREREERQRREEEERRRKRELEERRHREEAEERRRREEEEKEMAALKKLMKDDDERKRKEAAQGEPPPGKFRCPGCGLFQLNEARFCGECGVKISACPSCKKPQVTGQPCLACEQSKKEQEIKRKQQEAEQRKAKAEADKKEREARAKKEAEERERREKEEREREAKEKRDREERDKKDKREREERDKREREERDKREREEREKREKAKEKEQKEAKEKERTKSVHAAPPSKAPDEKKDTLGPKNLAGLASMWDSKVAQADDEIKNNVFSAHYDPNAAKKLKPGDKGYGSAPEGSESAVRAQKANDWVKVQVKQLIDVIGEIGTAGPGGLKQTNFGTLFVRYETISDTVVGILQRAKKYGVVTFEGEMLFQGQSNGVVIALTVTAASFSPK